MHTNANDYTKTQSNYTFHYSHHWSSYNMGSIHDDQFWHTSTTKRSEFSRSIHSYLLLLHMLQIFPELRPIKQKASHMQSLSLFTRYRRASISRGTARGLSWYWKTEAGILAIAMATVSDGGAAHNRCRCRLRLRTDRTSEQNRNASSSGNRLSKARSVASENQDCIGIALSETARKRTMLNFIEPNSRHN